MDKAVNLEGSVSDLHDKLSSMHSENNAKDDLVLKHIKVAEEAIAGWEKAEAESVFLKQELDEVLRQRITAEERIADLDAALKECMQQLRFDREEQERNIKVAVMQICREHEHDWKVLEEKLEETSKKLAKSEYENSHLSKTLQTKEKMIEDLFKLKSDVERNFNQLVARLDSEEKSNLRLSDASQKEHKCNMAKIIKLEKECQRLRLLVQKQLPRPATLEGLKSEVLSKELEEFNSQTFSLIPKNFTSPNSPDKRINFLLEKLCSMEEETRILKESVTKKNNEINSLKIMSANAASNLWSSSKSLTGTEHATGTSHDPSLTSFSESGFEDEISCAESWASALVTERQQITTRNSKGASTSKRVGLSGMNLMDDFVEMEKLAAVSVYKAFERSSVNESITCMYSSGTDLCLQPSATSGKELNPDSHLGSGETSHGIQQKKVLIGIYPSWIQDILRLALQQVHSTKKHPNEILEELGIALAQILTIPRKVNDARENEGCSNSSDTISCAPPNVPLMASSLQESGENVSPRQIQQSDVSKSIRRIIELIEGIDQPSLTDYSSPIVPDDNGSSLAYNSSASSTDYIVRVFQWKGSELRAILQRFVHTCNDLINGKASLEIFSKELSSSLEWIYNHCFSVQDVSRMRDTVKQHFDWDDSESESELGSVVRCPQLVAERVYAFDEHLYSRSSAGINGQTDYSQPEEVQLKLKEENTTLKQKLLNMESVQKDLEGKLQLETEKIEELLVQLRESEECVRSFQTKLEQKGIVENQTGNPRFLQDDRDSELTVTRNKLGMVYQNSLSLELELENKINRCQELETTCIELQLQLDSVAKGDVQKYDASALDEQLQTDQELSAASEKLTECQETILSLGKQLKALASPKEAALLEKVVSITPATVTKSRSATHRCSLLDQMLFEDNTNFGKKKETIHPVGDPEKSLAHPSGIPGTAHGPDGQVRSQGKLPCSNEPKYKDKDGAGRAVAIVPSKRCGAVSLLRLITRRRKRENDKKSLTMVA